ncbi:MAG TPA: porphobilinogen synthase, partial [Balneolaceae bacterium]|nr:porphobilinogen synthase [Balneolaceae bacterium]
RNRQTSAIREMVQENRLHPSDFIAPIFIMEGEDQKEEISSMPGYFRYTLDVLGKELEELIEVGIQSVLLFVKV